MCLYTSFHTVLACIKTVSVTSPKEKVVVQVSKYSILVHLPERNGERKLPGRRRRVPSVLSPTLYLLYFSICAYIHCARLPIYLRWLFCSLCVVDVLSAGGVWVASITVSFTAFCTMLDLLGRRVVSVLSATWFRLPLHLFPSLSVCRLENPPLARRRFGPFTSVLECGGGILVSAVSSFRKPGLLFSPLSFPFSAVFRLEQHQIVPTQQSQQEQHQNSDQFAPIHR